MPRDAHVPTALGALVALLLLLALAPQASARPLYGAQGVEGSVARTVADVVRADQAGVDVIRVQAFWSGLEPRAAGERDAAALAALDQVVGAARARGLKVILFAVGTPCWNSTAPAAVRAGCESATNPAVYRYQPARFEPFAAFSAFIVARYRTSLAAYQVWNEPDQSNEQYWAGPSKVARYSRMVRATYAPVKRVAPEVPVLVGSFVGMNGAWLKAMYANGIKGSYDGLAVHFYTLPLNGLAATRAVQRANGDTKPLWLTEFGFSSCWERGGPAERKEHACVTRTQQARNVRDVVRAVSRTPWIKAAVLYTMRDQDRDYRFGLLDARGAPKPVYRTLKKELAGSLRGRPSQRLRLSASRGRLVASGAGSSVELLELRVRQRGVLRYRTRVVADRFGRFTLRLPAGLATSGVSATLRGAWTKRSTSARR